MLTIADLVESPEAKTCIAMGWHETPVYVRNADGDPVLFELCSIRAGEIETAAGGRHSVLILEASDVTATEATP